MGKNVTKATLLLLSSKTSTIKQEVSPYFPSYKYFISNYQRVPKLNIEEGKQTTEETKIKVHFFRAKKVAVFC